jgi:hypothetical protein
MRADSKLGSLHVVRDVRDAVSWRRRQTPLDAPCVCVCVCVYVCVCVCMCVYVHPAIAAAT